jgi:hypothetical protein
MPWRRRHGRHRDATIVAVAVLAGVLALLFVGTAFHAAFIDLLVRIEGGGA